MQYFWDIQYMTSYRGGHPNMTKYDEGGGRGKNFKNLYDVICECSLMVTSWQW